jgi:RimJ/RimL family protein N-acetyltransferase
MKNQDFELQPILEGSLIRLRPLREKDFEELYQCASDPKIWEQHPQSTRYKRDVFQKYFEAAMESGGAFAIYDAKTEKMIGSSRYYAFDAQKNQILIGYTFIAKEYWGGVFNRELKKLMIEHAFKFVDKVVFEIGDKNTRSQMAVQRIGAKFIGTDYLDGKSHVVYQILKSEYQGL